MQGFVDFLNFTGIKTAQLKIALQTVTIFGVMFWYFELTIWLSNCHFGKHFWCSSVIATVAQT